ncbi:MAG: prephenate dehydrogenase/arogenate dehydrogenase family protein [Candidatus Promineifilaceae bacterium]
MKARTVSLIGLDRLSGSLALALRKAGLGLGISGADAARPVAEKALELGILDSIDSNQADAAAAADILILNLPLNELEETLARVGPAVQPHALVLDLAPLKGPGLKWAAQYLDHGHYVGVTPVVAAGVLEDGRGDIVSASADLFRDGILCLMPSPAADPQAVETAVNLGRLIGATPFFLDAQEYDGLMHGVETLPGLLAAALFRASSLAPGWRDMLRFAGRPFAQAAAGLKRPDLAALALNDRLATLRWLDALLAEVQTVRRWVEQGDAERLELLLADVAQQHGRWLASRQANDWSEDPGMPDVSNMSFGNQLFGGTWRRKRDGDKKS